MCLAPDTASSFHPLDAGPRAVIRGGNLADGADAGAFAVGTTSLLAGPGGGMEFRCALVAHAQPFNPLRAGLPTKSPTSLYQMGVGVVGLTATCRRHMRAW
ncbi:MAG: hypothetical protein HYY11_00675 [Candidatus Methylomirabilis oxyfera]|nr:hypothetical protein [Candidatus Methylomirabilis oxyfera]